MTSCASSIGQHAATAALQHVGEGWMSERIAELKVKRDLAFKMIKDIPGVHCDVPRGAFYILPGEGHRMQPTRRESKRERKVRTLTTNANIQPTLNPCPSFPSCDIRCQLLLQHRHR